MNRRLESKLKKLPQTPGVYFHKDKTGEIIYVGKAANLRNRVRQYFQPATRLRASKNDPKTEVLISEIADIEWRELDTEADALFLEAELVRRYQPRFNIMLRDDKSLLYVRIDYKSDYPTVSLVRRPLDDGAQYFGPYLNGYALKKALSYLRRAFPYATARPAGAKRVNLHYHLGLDPGLEEGRTSLTQYQANLRKLIKYLRGQRVELVRTIERDMRKAAAKKEYELAASLRNQLTALKELNRQILFSDRENLDLTRDEALASLADLTGLANPPRRIEAYDISHTQGTDTTASMVVFNNGAPNKTAYRKFKMRTPGNDDFAHINEVISRRFSEKNVARWPLPDLVLIDGGKGQLSAGLQALDKRGFESIPAIGLAKQHEDIILKKLITPQKHPSQGQTLERGSFIVIRLPAQSPVVRLLQRIRDESHRFALSYHSSLRAGRQTSSLLDEIPGIGPASRKKLIKHFGSTKAVLLATPDELTEVLGDRRGQQAYMHIKAHHPSS